MTPEFSVVLPVYNRSSTLGRAIQSVLVQSFRDFELLIVDDGSTDDSLAVARSFNDPRIRLIVLQENGGGGAARNAGVRASKAPIITFLDSDDEYLPGKLERVASLFNEQPRLELLVDSFVRLDPAARFRGRVIRRNPRISDQYVFKRALLTRRLWKATPSISVRRNAALKAGLFDEGVKRMQDFDFLMRASSVATCGSVDDVLWVKHRQKSSISAEDNLIAENVELCRRFPEYLANPAYRPGMGYILRLSLLRRVTTLSLGGAANDVMKLVRAFGRREAIHLLLDACRPRPSIG